MTHTAADALLPCPFCGTQVDFRKYNQVHHPEHQTCYLSGMNFNDGKEWWNTRTALQAAPKENKPLYRVRDDGSFEMVSCSSCDALVKALEICVKRLKDAADAKTVYQPQNYCAATLKESNAEQAIAAHRAKQEQK